MLRNFRENITTGLLVAGVLVISACAQALSAQPPKLGLAQANSALQAGEADKALALLRTFPKQGPGAAETHNLECRVLFTLEEWNAAARECEQAVKLDGQNSNYHLWLGRALGEKAARASFVNAYSLGKRVRSEFEESVRLNPRNAEALADLGEFYYEAPGIIGGGTNKAQAVAAQLDKVDPARAHSLRGRIAEAHKDYGTTEREFKLALTVSTHPAYQWMTLTSFYGRRQRWPEMETAVHNCVTAASHDQHAGVALYDAASVLTRANRDFELAAKMLESYLANPLKTEEAPAFRAHLRLAHLKEQLGDMNAAKRERAAAAALAHDYRPSQEAKH